MPSPRGCALRRSWRAVRRDDDALTQDEKLKADFIRAVVHGTMTGDLYRAVENRIGVRAAVELTAFTGHLIKTCRLMQAWGVTDITRDELEEFVQAIADGDVELPRGARVPPAGVAGTSDND